MNSLIRTCLCMTLCFSFSVLAGQLYGQIDYTITGVASIFSNNTDVAHGETYVANFQIDLSVPDSDPNSERGEYLGAILSSSIEFEGGYKSQVDFTGGKVTIHPDNPGGGVFLFDASGLGAIVIFDVDNPFDSDALLTDPATQFVGSPDSLLSLSEANGFVISTSNAFLSPTRMAFSVKAAAVASLPVLLGDSNQDGVVNFEDIPSFISILLAGDYLPEADTNQDEVVDFSDISSFISNLLG